MSVSGVSSSFAYNPFASRATSSAADGRLSRDLANVQSLGAKLGPIMPAPPDLLRKLLEAQYTRPVGEPDNAPSQLYAEIRAGNKTIGKVYNTGACETPNNLAGRVQFGGPDEDGLHGPELAQLRAEKIARACGGTIVKSDTAVTQAEFDARPPRQFHVDYELMNAEIERIRQSTEASSQLYRQMLAASAPGPSTDVTV